MTLNGVSIVNDNGSAINIQSPVQAEIVLRGSNWLCDSKKYNTPAGEDENATLFCSSSMRISGDGTLEVDAVKKHAICAKSGPVTIASGIVNVNSSASDGIHGIGFTMTGGEYNCKAITGDPVDADTGAIELTDGVLDLTVATADTKGLKADSEIYIGGISVVLLRMSGNQTKGIKSKADITLDGDCYVWPSAATRHCPPRRLARSGRWF